MSERSENRYHQITANLGTDELLETDRIAAELRALGWPYSNRSLVLREAVASGEIRVQRATLDLIASNRIAKGNVLAAARLAGIQAAKKTGDLIPLCHPLPISHCEVRFEIPKSRDRILITASAKIAAQTGVEMEALTAVTVAALTIYDMCKAVDNRMTISRIKLVSKTKRDAPPALL